MSRNQRIVVIVVLCAMAGFTFVLTRRRGPRNQESFLAEVPMSDGVHRLRLLKIVDGPLVYDWKDPTPALLRALPLPAKVRPPYVPFSKVTRDGMAAYKSMGGGDKTPGYTFLFRVVDANGEYSANQGVSELSFVESTGHEFEDPRLGDQHPGFWGVSTFTRAVLPRRDKRLRIRAKEQYVPGGILEFEVDNPAYRAVEQEWVPEPLPTTRSFEGLPVTLKSAGRNAFNINLQAGERGWMPDHQSFWLEDVTGNRGQKLSPFEPAWKLHMQLTPWFEAMPRDQVWTNDDVAVPPPGVEVPLKLEKEIDGVTLRLGSIVGGDIGSGKKNVKEDGPSNSDNSGFRDDCPRFNVTAKSSHRDFAVAVVISWNGERLNAHGRHAYGEFTRDIDAVIKKLPAESRIKIEIGVGRPRDVEFLVDPKEFRERPRGSKPG